jgi:hypothetical protein
MQASAVLGQLFLMMMFLSYEQNWLGEGGGEGERLV